MARDIARGSQFTCHPLTNHTCLYCPAAGHHRPLAGTHCAYPRRDGQAELAWVTGQRCCGESFIISATFGVNSCSVVAMLHVFVYRSKQCGVEWRWLTVDVEADMTGCSTVHVDVPTRERQQWERWPSSRHAQHDWQASERPGDLDWRIIVGSEEWLDTPRTRVPTMM